MPVVYFSSKKHTFTELNYDLVVEIDGSSCRDRESFINEVAEACQFPQFGGNLDAVKEFLSDLSWLDADIILVQILNFEDIFIDQPDMRKRIFKMLFNIIDWDAKNIKYKKYVEEPLTVYTFISSVETISDLKSLCEHSAIKFVEK